MRKIKLTRNKYALVDDEDFERVNRLNWSAYKAKNTWYAYTQLLTKQGKFPFMLHWFIIGKPRKGLVSDHKNGNGLDNRKSNLRKVTCRQNSQNQANRKIKKSSKYPGVSFFKRTKKWLATIRINGKRISLGLYDTEKGAFIAYRAAVNLLGQSVLYEGEGEENGCTK